MQISQTIQEQLDKKKDYMRPDNNDRCCPDTVLFPQGRYRKKNQLSLSNSSDIHCNHKYLFQKIHFFLTTLLNSKVSYFLYSSTTIFLEQAKGMHTLAKMYILCFTHRRPIMNSNQNTSKLVFKSSIKNIQTCFKCIFLF